MDNDLKKIADALNRKAANAGPPAFYDAQVIAIDVDNYLCDIMLYGEVEVPQCRLRAVVSGNKSVDVLPASGSAIVVGKLYEDGYILIAADVITSYRLTIGTMVFTLDETGALISNGTISLKDILTNLVNGLLSVASPKDVPNITLILTQIDSLLQ